MDRREFLKTSGIGLASLALGDELLAAGKQPAGKRPPNFLFIMSDQQRWDALGAAGNKDMYTPNLDKLAKDGVRFDKCYVGQAVCSPSRACIMSGLYPHAHKVRDNIYGIGDVISSPEYNMGTIWPILLRKAGYRTCWIGKWHLGEKDPKCFDEWHGFNSKLSHWMREPYKSLYRPDAKTNQALTFLQTNARRPFTLCVSYYPPHTPYTAPEKYWHYYENAPLKPLEYYAACSNIDWNIGRLLAKLEDLDLMENTFIIFTSDHGDHFGKRPGNPHKRGAYDECARVPLIMHHPKLARGGAVKQELVSNVDLMPTILDVAGVRHPKGLHGMSLLPVLANRKVQWRDAVTIVNREDLSGKEARTGGEACNSRGVRTENWKLILRDRLSVRATDLRELYDLKNDPGEHATKFGTDCKSDVLPILAKLESWARKVGDQQSLDLAAACRTDLGGS